MSHHHHHHGPTQGHISGKLAIGSILNLLYVIVEGAFGLAVGSMSLVADASHNFSDVLGLLLAWGAVRLSQVSATERKTYGMRRSTILSSLLNAILLLVAVGAIGVEAIHKIMTPAPTSGMTVIVVALIGMIINGITAFILAGNHHDLNVRSAFLHMLADTAISFGVVLTGVVYLYTGWTWVDPVVSLLIAVMIAISTWDLFRESVHLALDGVPKEIDSTKVAEYFRAIPGISNCHDLHIWALSSTEAALTVHLVKPDGQLDDALLDRIRHELHDQFHIEHASIQLEACDCHHPCSITTPIADHSKDKAH